MYCNKTTTVSNSNLIYYANVLLASLLPLDAIDKYTYLIYLLLQLQLTLYPLVET